ncbi:MAG: hypothetical protein ACLQU3_10975 [Limisphaerales bacterium]
MNRRALLSGFLVLVCLTALWGLWRQQCRLAVLRDQQQLLLAQPAPGAVGSESAEMTGPADASSSAPQPALVVTPELLHLRSEVTRLTERRRELAGVRAENEALRARLTSRGTNGAGGSQLPTGYMHRSEARFVGYNTPDDTLQSLLWAVQNHDLTNVLQAFTPEIAARLRAQVGESPESIEDFWQKSVGLIGCRIVSRETDPSDGSITAEVEVVPGQSGPRPTFRQINGQWKMEGGC